jgi:hypothetical protein
MAMDIFHFVSQIVIGSLSLKLMDYSVYLDNDIAAVLGLLSFHIV